MPKSILSLLLFLLLSSNISAQNLIKNLNSIKKAITTVESESKTIEPIFEFESNTYGRVDLSVSTTSSKGNASLTKYSWNMADIEPNTVVRFVKGKEMLVNIAVRNKQKFIKSEENGKLSYISELSIPVNNADAAQIIIDEIKSSVGFAKLGKLNWDSFSSSMNWLVNNVEDQQIQGKMYSQKWAYYPNEKNKIIFTQIVTSSKGETTENSYEFYMNDLFENTVNFNISGDRLEVELKTIGSQKLIKHIKNGTKSSYISGIEILDVDVEKARNMINALQTAISKCEVKSTKYVSVSNALSFVDSQIANISDDKETIEQSLKSASSGRYEANYIRKTINSKGGVKEEKYLFYWSHIDANFIQLDVSGSSLFIELQTKGKQKFITHTTDAKTLPLCNDLKFEVSDLAIAREIINALKYSIPLSTPQLPNFTSSSQAISWLEKNINLITIDDKNYEQVFEVVNGKYILNSNYSDSKGKSKNSSYEFYPFTLEKNMVNIEVKSEEIYLNLGVLFKNKYVRNIENGLLSSYDSEVNIICKDVIEAEIMKSAFQYIIENAAKPKDFESVKQARAFLMNNINKVEIPGTTYDQSISNKDGDACVILYNYDEVSAKGKAESRLYELNLGYLYPDQIKLDVKGKDLFIEAFTRGKQKLIKSYKNSELQNYSTSIIFQVDDVLAGLKLEIALKMLAKDCEK